MVDMENYFSSRLQQLHSDKNGTKTHFCLHSFSTVSQLMMMDISSDFAHLHISYTSYILFILYYMYMKYVIYTADL